MDKFLERHKLPKFTPKGLNSLISPIPTKEFEFIHKNLQTKKTPGPDNFIGKCYQTFKEEIQLKKKIFQITEEEGTLLNSFYEDSITLTTAPEKNIIRKDNDRWLPVMNINKKTLNKTQANQVQQ